MKKPLTKAMNKKNVKAPKEDNIIKNVRSFNTFCNTIKTIISKTITPKARQKALM